MVRGLLPSKYTGELRVQAQVAGYCFFARKR